MRLGFSICSIQHECTLLIDFVVTLLLCLAAGQIAFHVFVIQVSIDRLSSLDIVHRLFESVAASVFRPIDILLKVLFARPNKLVSSLHCTLYGLLVTNCKITKYNKQRSVCCIYH